MFNAKHYVPILKGKEGEFAALRSLDASTKDALTPMIEITAVPWDYTNDQPQRTLDEHLRPIADKILRSWLPERPIFVDVRWIPGTDTVDDGRTALSYVLDDARAKGLTVIPVTGFGRSPQYRTSVKNAIATDGNGVCLRLERDDFATVSGAYLDAFLDDLQVNPETVDLVIDFRDIIQGQDSTLALAAQAIISNLPHIEKWRSLTLSASAFPINLSGVPANTTFNAERTEWLLWQSLRARRSAIPRFPTFSDYAISHPDVPDDVDPRTMRMSANLRYTASEYWLLLKERNVKNYGFDQFNDLCRELVSRPEYSGRGFSWGDTFIDDRASNQESPGNATTWRRVGTSHHLTFVTRQIASLP